MTTYTNAKDIMFIVDNIIDSLDLFHIDKGRLHCIRSKGSSSRGTLARIHSFPKVYQIALGMKPVYIIEIISENFDGLPEEEKEKVLIHELLHIPKGFSGGVMYHRQGYESTVELYYRAYKSKRENRGP
jgi:predicted metallopeptidase